MTDQFGKFALTNLFGGNSSPSVTNGSTTIALSPSTGLPLLSPNISSVVIPATSTDPLQIRFTDTTSNTALFKASIVPPSTLQVIGPNDNYNGINPVLRVEPLGGSDVIATSLSDPNLPGGMYVTASSIPFLAIDSHGQIYLLDGSVTMRATEEA